MSNSWKRLAKKLWHELRSLRANLKYHGVERCVPMDHICPRCDHWGWRSVSRTKSTMEVYCPECGKQWTRTTPVDFEDLEGL